MPSPKPGGAARAAIRVLFMTLIITGMGQSFIFAVLPPLSRDIGLSEGQVGVIVTASAVLFMLVSPLWGRGIDRWGRRVVILTCLTGSMILTALFGVTVDAAMAGLILAAPLFWTLVLLRAGFALVGGGLFPAAQAFIADATSETDRTAGVAIIGMAFGMGSVMGPAFAAVIAALGPAASFYAIAILGLGTAALGYRYLKEPPRRTAVGGALPPVTGIMKLLPFLAMASITMTSMAILQIVIGFRVQDLFELERVAAQQTAGWGLIAVGAGMFLAQLLLVRRLRWPAWRLVRTGAPGMMAATLLLLAAESLPMLIGGMGLFGVSIGLVFPGVIASLTLAAGAEAQGRVAGLGGAAQGLGFVLGPLLGTLLYGVAPQAPYAMAALLVTLLTVLAFTTPRPDRLGVESA